MYQRLYSDKDFSVCFLCLLSDILASRFECGQGMGQSEELTAVSLGQSAAQSLVFKGTELTHL